MPASFVHSLFFYTPHGRLGSTGSFFPPTDRSGRSHYFSLLQQHSVEETLIDFGYTYAPNLIHQGASIITEISSANGYKNSASSNSYEVIHGPELTQKKS
jgi:hypothetical protein